ncbi:MAG TPA: peptide-methionine (S)-S-oxide reductase [Planctomycetaceae bacterium]|nr:peptide-methionine (S)-S-oxide reductase [Planctomycetaceae bacterium]
MSASDVNEAAEYDDLATLGGGCFWCVEAVFEEMQGVGPVVSGYAGGKVPNPSYRDVCTGSTGHAEVCQIHFDSKQVTFEQLLEVFFRTHDPTTLNRQGHDVGTQYRSTIMYHTDEQKHAAERIIAGLNASGAFRNPIVTEVVSAPTFYEAEEEHQDYFRRNPGAGYCVAVVAPKVEKFRQVFPNQQK